MMQNLIKRIISLMVVTVMLSSCANTTHSPERYYTDQFDQILTNDDVSKIVILGRKYHYIFSPEKAIAEITKAGGVNGLKMILLPFNMAENNVIQGKLSLKIDEHSLTKSQQNWLKKLGFSATPNELGQNIYSHLLYIKGNRYRISNNIDYSYNNSLKLSKQYTLNIYEQHQSNNLSAIANTPVEITKGVLTAGGMIIALPLVLGMGAIICTKAC